MSSLFPLCHLLYMDMILHKKIFSYLNVCIYFRLLVILSVTCHLQILARNCYGNFSMPFYMIKQKMLVLTFVYTNLFLLPLLDHFFWFWPKAPKIVCLMCEAPELKGVGVFLFCLDYDITKKLIVFVHNSYVINSFLSGQTMVASILDCKGRFGDFLKVFVEMCSSHLFVSLSSSKIWENAISLFYFIWFRIWN